MGPVCSPLTEAHGSARPYGVTCDPVPQSSLPPGWGGEPLAVYVRSPHEGPCLTLWSGGERAVSEEWFARPSDLIKRIDELSCKAKALLGERGVSRFQEFKRYRKGWDFDHGEELSKSSTAVLDMFLNEIKGFGESNPSIFMTQMGNLELSWEDETGAPVEVEFFADKVEFYLGASDEEGEIVLDPESPSLGIRKLIEKLGLST